MFSSFQRIGKLLLSFALLASISVYAGGTTRAAEENLYFHTDGNKIVDASGKEAVFNGLNWFGFETPNYSPHGLWTRSMDDVLDQIKEEGYNLIRLPFCNQMFDEDSEPNSIRYDINADLVGLKPIEIMDKLIKKAGDRGIRIFLDRHRPDSGGQSTLWYTSAYPESRWISDWVMLADRYKDDPTVIGADLHNEPHGAASWGTGDLATDWRLAAQRAGNAILAANPNWLIIVEGIEKNVQGNDSKYWWGGNLTGVRDYPVQLSVPNRVVYSPHDYGPGVASQPWFDDPTFPNNMAAIWDATWGYISKEGIAPLIVGEFGGRSVDTVTVEGRWQNALVDYIGENGLYWTYWTVNPNSGDTGGLLQDDWATWNRPKQDMLDRIMKPVTFIPTNPDNGGGTQPEVIEVAPLYLVGDKTASTGSIRANLQLKNNSNVPVKLSDVTVRYWYTEDGNSDQNVVIDHATVGKTNVVTSVVPVTPAKPKADKYVEFSFLDGAGKLAVNGNSGEVQFRVHNTNWTNLNQENDYSFDPTSTSYAANDRITVYYKGNLIFGIEP